MRRELTLILLVTLASLTTESWSAAKSTASVAALAKPSEENGYDTIRAAAYKIILKIDSIRLGTYQPLSATHTGAIESLKTISVMDSEYWKKEAWREGHGTVKLTPENLRRNREIRQQALTEYRASAKNVLDEWQKVIDAVSMTESAIDLLDDVKGMESDAAAVRQMLPAWLAIRDDLRTVTAIARGEQDGVPDNPSTHEPQTGFFAARLVSGIKVPIDAMRSHWDRIYLTAGNLSEKTHAASSERVTSSPGFGDPQGLTTSSSMDASQIVSTSIGVFLILLLLVLVFWRRNLTEAEYTFARIVLALAVACVAVLLTGFLNVDLRGAIQAGGAFAAFVIVYKLAPAKLHGSSEWQDIRSLWGDRHDLHDDPASANQDDVVSSINAVNQAARTISDDDSLFRPFKQDYGEDFFRLYTKLTNNKYLVASANSTSDLLLTGTARKLALRIPCTT